MITFSKQEAQILFEVVGDDNPELAAKLASIAYPPKLVNLTSHDIVVFEDGAETARCTLPTEGCARVYTQDEDVELINGTPVVTRITIGFEGLPEPQPNTLYIVSNQFAQYAGQGRDDLVVPNRIVRDLNGRVIGCRSFARV